MSNFCTWFSVNRLRATLSIVAATAMFALTAADSNDQLQYSNGFLYSHYLQSPSTNTKHDFAVNNQHKTPWKDAVSHAANAVQTLPLSHYFAEQLFNDQQPAVRQATHQLAQQSWQLGANLIELGVQSAAKETLGRAFRNAEVHVETEIGRAPSNAGLNVVGALRESDTNAIGWQLRGFSGFEDSRFGGNFGLIMRSIIQQQGQDLLIGGNAFVDYETVDSDGFLRWSLGAEMRSEWIDFFANKYVVVDGPADKQNGAWVYSANGYDMQLHVHSPNAPVLTGVLGYYLWEGERQQSDDSGLLAGIRLTPSQLPLKVQVDYRTGEGKHVGGEVSYTHEFGSQDLQSLSRDFGFYPKHYFFAPVEREYTQQIINISAPAAPDDSPAALQIKQLNGLAGVRATASSRGDRITTNLGLNGSGNRMSIAGVLRNNNITATTETLPWQLPTATNVGLNTFSDSTLQIEWLSGAGKNASIDSNSNVNVAPNAMQMFDGHVETSADRGFRFFAPNVTIALRGGGQFDVRVNDNGGMVSVSGRFMMNVGNLSYQNDGRQAGGVSIAFDSNGAVTLERVTSGEIIFSDGSQILTIMPPQPLGISIRVNPDLFGNGLENSPILMPINFPGNIAEIIPVGGFRGDYAISPASQGFMTISADGNIRPLAALESGTYDLAFEVSRGAVQSAFTVYFSVGDIVTVTASGGVLTVSISLPGNAFNSPSPAGVSDEGTSETSTINSPGNDGIITTVSGFVIGTTSDSAEKPTLTVCDLSGEDGEFTEGECQRRSPH